MTFNLMIAGVGGQGTVLASKLIAAAGMKKGYHVRTTETIGMAQRGGSVVSHVRIGDNIFSPLIPLGKAQSLIAFEPSEAVRQLPYLCREGSIIVSDVIIKPAGSSPENPFTMIDYLKKNVHNLIVADGRQLTGENVKTLNVALLGTASQKGFFPFDAETLIEVIKEMLPQKILEMNLRAFELGRTA
ncbi:MAG: indolepyruvate oxidoreductase subunit beta [Treponema sp.]|nr:indolepyruvate oxidoreductase subunit beta [Treponema sp.]MCL2271824.1 indolepyruvate oxidoreductase subunit beta [Treponema sp.]